MEDISTVLSSLLEDPERLEQLKKTAQNLLGGNENPPKSETNENTNDNSSFSVGDSAAMISKIMPLISAMDTKDNNSMLLDALRPYLNSERQKKLDQSRKLMQIMRIIPLLKQQNIL